MLGLATHGGWWALGLRDSARARLVVSVPTSTPFTGERTRQALRGAGLSTELIRTLTDVDDAKTCAAVARSAPATRFAQLADALSGGAHVTADATVVHSPPVFETVLVSGRGRLVDQDGSERELAVPTWSGAAGPADLGLIGRCTGPTLDIGCGPGRITAALAGRGVAALGVDVSAYAVALTRARGAAALRRDVFALTVGRGRWQHVLPADGNVGIGGDPVRLPWHCRDLITTSGSVLVDLEPPGTGLTSTDVRLVSDDRTSDWFSWARLGVDAVEPLAAGAGLAVREIWRIGRRWQAELVPTGVWASTRPERHEHS